MKNILKPMGGMKKNNSVLVIGSFMHSVEKRLQQISEHPEYFGKRRNNRFREAKVEHFPYMIVYEFLKQKGVIYIAAIYHSSRRDGGKYRRTS